MKAGRLIEVLKKVSPDAEVRCGIGNVPTLMITNLLNLKRIPKYEFFDVTADIEFYAYGNNLNEAFENAGLALFNIISKTDNINPITSKSFEITSEDKVSLLYDFLEELLFLHEIEFMLFSEFKVMIDKIDGGYHLNATIEGEDINWDKHYRGDEVKAITFHKMNIVEGNAVKLSAIVDLDRIKEIIL